MKTVQDVYDYLQVRGNNIDDVISWSHKIKTAGKTKNMTVGRVWFNLLLPDDYILIDRQIKKGDLTEIVYDVLDKYGPAISSEVISTINTAGFKMSTISPSTLNINSFQIPKHIEEKRQKIFKENLDPVEFSVKITELSTEYIDYMKESNPGVYNVIRSKAKMGDGDWAVLMLAKGSTGNIENVKTPIIKKSVSDGLDLKQMYAAASEARLGLFIRSKGSSEPGALARDIFFANSTSIIKSVDCGTKKYLNVDVTKNLLKRLNDRNYLDKKTNKLVMINQKSIELIGQTISLRSPIYCLQKDGLCETCYGGFAKKMNTKHVGLLTGAVVNSEILNKYSMKARHGSLAKLAQSVDFTKDIIKLSV